jgi:uncharacterized repeat protein (TIGR04138 family)
MAKDLLNVAQRSGYAVDAFLFVQRGLDFTVRHIHGEPQARSESEPRSRHVSGQQLCQGLREYALEQYGLLARTVLRHWNIQRSEDFGRIVFAMIDAGLMAKTDEDSLADFNGVYDFNQAFATTLKIGGAA